MQEEGVSRRARRGYTLDRSSAVTPSTLPPFEGGAPSAEYTANARAATAAARASLASSAVYMPHIQPDQRDTALLVLYYLKSEFPKLEPLFRSEASKILRGFDAQVPPLPLRVILAEYREMKAEQKAHRQLIHSINNFSRITGAPPVLQATLTRMAQLAEDYVQFRDISGLNRGEDLPPLVVERPELPATAPLPGPAPRTTMQVASAARLPRPPPAVPTLPIFASSTNPNANAHNAAAAANRPSAEVALSEAKRRRKGSSPKKRVTTGTSQANGSSAVAAPAAASNDEPSFEFDDLGLPSFQFPDAIPLPAHGPSAVAHLEVDPEGYELLIDEASGLNFPEALARYINQAAAASAIMPRTNSDTLAPVLQQASSNPIVSSVSPPGDGSPVPNLNFSHDVMLEIAQKVMDDPVSKDYLAGAFAATIEGAQTPSEAGGAYTTGPNTPALDENHAASPIRRSSSRVTQSPATPATPASNNRSAPRRSPKGLGITLNAAGRSGSTASAATVSGPSPAVPHPSPNARKRKEPPTGAALTAALSSAATPVIPSVSPGPPATSAAVSRVPSNSAQTAAANDSMDVDEQNLLAALGPITAENVNDIIASLRRT